VGEKLRRDIYALTLNAADRNVRSSVSIGLVVYPDDGTSVEQLVAAADVAMYEAKRRGKNRIVGYQVRTERVATDIDESTGTLVQLAPAEDVRTGGDPAPWGPRTPEGRVPVFHEAGGPVERGTAPGEGPAGPGPSSSPGRSAIPVEPDEFEEPPWSSAPVSGSPTTTERRTDRLSVQPPVDPTSPPAPTRTAVEAPGQPWLTRTDGFISGPEPGREAGSGQAPRTAEEQGPRLAQQPGSRPADSRGTGGWRSRTEEIGGDDERPWIALPIEPDEPPDRR